MEFTDFKNKIDIKFLNEHINEIIELNIPYPYTLNNLIYNESIRQSAKQLFHMRGRENNGFYYNIKHIDSRENEDYYEYEFRKLIEYIQKVPKFERLLK
jgi:hypothetical protein